MGQIRLENGDIYKGNFRNDVRHGSGICQFKSGALYRGEFKDDKPNGLGILYSGKNEIIECKFQDGMIPDQKLKIMFADGQYYEGQYSNHRRHVSGRCFYPNGDYYDGPWESDRRVGRNATMKFNNNTIVYKG